ncbi:MAG TPA: hypothetical protein VNA25_16120 [Phycisphaerae bacterium]|nr:hypothetical protein [Phycisphaerae bacterium]
MSNDEFSNDEWPRRSSTSACRQAGSALVIRHWFGIRQSTFGIWFVTCLPITPVTWAYDCEEG